jgi:hypothetical protein
MLLSYCNHGFMSFDQWKEYCARQITENGGKSHLEPRYKELDVAKLAKEIADEAPSDAEFGAMIKRFTESHSMTEGKLLACGACGIRQMEHKHPDVQYKPVKLTNPMMDVLKYSHDAAVDLHHKLQCKVTIAVDEQGTQAEICPWRMISFYEPPCSIQQSAEDVTYFHLHPELVSCCHDEPYTYLCPTCLDKLKHGTVPPMSIAAGVDFGHFRRIPELADLNFHEEMILALNRVYFAAVKISSNEFGHVNYSQSRIKGHFILIPDNSFEEVLKNFWSSRFAGYRIYKACHPSVYSGSDWNAV